MAIQYHCNPEQFRAQLLRILKEDEAKFEEFLKKLPNFGDSYQKWYSEAQAIIKQVLPDRLSDLALFAQSMGIDVAQCS